MPPAITDKFLEVGNPGTATNLSGAGYTIGATSITVDTTTNWPTNSLVVFGIDVIETDSNGNEVRVDGSYCIFEGIVTGATTIGSVSKLFGTAQNYAAGANTRVYITISTQQTKKLIDGLMLEHNRNGSHNNSVVALLAGAQTFTAAKTFSVTPVVPDASWTDAKWRNNVAFLARLVTNQSIPNATTTKVLFATETFDTGANYDPATSYQFTAPYAGIYHFDAQVRCDAVGDRLVTYLFVNGVEVAFNVTYTGDLAADDVSGSVSITINLVANDVVDVRVNQNAGAARVLLGPEVGACYFSGHLISRT